MERPLLLRQCPCHKVDGGVGNLLNLPGGLSGNVCPRKLHTGVQ